MGLPHFHRKHAWPALLVLALTPGIGLAGAALSPLWRDAVIGLPLHRPDRLVVISEHSDARGWTDAPGSPANLTDWARRATTIAGLAFHTSSRGRLDDASEMVLGGPSAGQLVRVLATSPNLMPVLGVSPTRGRIFAAEDALPSSLPVAMVSAGLARRLGHPNGDAIGRTIRLDDRDHVIVGQMPEGFYFPTPDVGVWVPIRMDPAEFSTRRQARIFRVVARLRDDVSVADANRDLRAVAAALSREYPRTNGDTTVDVESLQEWLAGPRHVPTRIAATAGALILLIALLNAGLLAWMNDTARDRDRSLKRALGASNTRLTWEVTRETVITITAAFVCALPMGAVVLLVAATALGPEAERVLRFDWRAVAVAAAAAAVGLAAVRTYVVSRPAQVTAAPRSVRWVTGVQAAVTVALAVVAASTLRGFVSIASVPTGLPQNDAAVTATVTLRGPHFRDEQVVARYMRDALAALRTRPGVEAAGATALLPLQGAGGTSFIWLPERGVINAEVRHREITDGYIEAAGLPLREGRSFTAQDGLAERVLIVNEAFVRRVTGGRSPVGTMVSYSDPQTSTPRPWRVVGVVGDEPVDPRQTVDVPLIYHPHAINPEETMTFVVRSRERTSAAIAGLTQVLRDQDDAAVVMRAEPLSRALGHAVRRERAMAQLGGAVALVAVLLAGLGLHGLTSLDVRRRRRELAVRSALGAGLWRVRRDLAVRALTPACCGIVAGATVGAMTPMHNVVPTDLTLAAGVMFVAAGIAVVPALLSARRISAADLTRQ